MMLQEVPEAGKKLSANLNVAQNIKDVGNLGTKLLDDLGSFQDKLFATVRKDLGLLGVGVETLGKGLTKATDSVVKLGGGLNDAITYFTNINKALGRTTFLTEQAAINVRQLALVGVDDATIASFNKFFDSVGLGVEDATQQQKNLVDEARKYGLNVGAFMTKVNKETEKLTQYGFPKGINDLSKMVAQAQRLGVELGSVSKLADSIMGSPEKAFEIAADLQTLGGAFGQLGDGASLLYDAQNDLPGLQDKIVKAAASIATFNKESGQFEISAGERLRLKEVAGKLGLDVKELSTLATKAAAESKIFKELDLRPDFKNLSVEDKQLIANYSQFKGGKLTIDGDNIENLENGEITKVLKGLKEGVGQFTDTKKGVPGKELSANEELEKTYKNSLSINQAINQAQLEFNSTLTTAILPMEEFVRLTKDSAGTVNTLTARFKAFSDELLDSAELAIGGANVALNKPIIKPTSPGTSVQPNESNNALMSAKMIIEGKSQMDINIKSTLPEDFQKQIQGQLQTMLPSIIDARVKEILDKQGYSK
jgi:hypothetical protein